MPGIGAAPRRPVVAEDIRNLLWNAVADAMRADAASIGDMPDGMMGIWRAARLPESLASLEEKMTAQLEAVRRVKAAGDPLYEALSDDQKKTADELILGPIGVWRRKRTLADSEGSRPRIPDDVAQHSDLISRGFAKATSNHRGPDDRGQNGACRAAAAICRPLSWSIALKRGRRLGPNLVGSSPDSPLEESGGSGELPTMSLE